MTVKQIKDKGIFLKLLEQGLRIIVIKECNKIGNLNIDIVSTSNQIRKGEIQQINITAEDINYKDLLFDKFELNTNNLKINFKLSNKVLNFEDNPIIKFKISLSEKSLRVILFSNRWNWIKNLVSKEILSQERLEDVQIKNDQLIMKPSENSIAINQGEQINIKVNKGKLYLENKVKNTNLLIPIEDKIYIKNVNIENNLINIFANSSLSF